MAGVMQRWRTVNLSPLFAVGGGDDRRRRDGHSNLWADERGVQVAARSAIGDTVRLLVAQQPLLWRQQP